jgi:TolA-binding protein
MEVPTMNEPTIEELQAQIDSLQAKKLELQARRRNDVVAAINKMLLDNGMTLTDLVRAGSVTQSKGKRVKGAEKDRTEPGQYKNPASGEVVEYKRGRRPGWMAAMATEDLAKCKID